jgi:hypothetical protein
MEIIKFNDFMSGNYGKHRYEKVEVPLVAEYAAKDYEVISMLGDLSVTLVRVVLILFAVKFGLGFAIAFIHAMMPMPIGGV